MFKRTLLPKPDQSRRTGLVMDNPDNGEINHQAQVALLWLTDDGETLWQYKHWTRDVGWVMTVVDDQGSIHATAGPTYTERECWAAIEKQLRDRLG